MQSSFDLPFDFAHFVDVKPLLATATSGDIALTIDSIERYEHGFVLVLWVKATHGPTHLFAISARDGAGNSCAGSMEAGYGSGGDKTGWLNRVVYSFVPALDPAAGSLTLIVSQARRLRLFAPREMRMRPEDVIGGPSELTFAISHIRVGDGGTSAANSPAAAERPAATNSGSLVFPPSMAANSAFMYTGGSSPGGFRPQTLERVIPVAQHQEVELFAITLLSLECYADGFTAVVRTDYPEPFMRLPTQFAWNAEDDRGGRYQFRGATGSSGGIPDQTTSWRVDCRFTPTLNEAAQQLRLWVENAVLSNATVGQKAPEKRVSILGRWEFVIPL